MDGYEVDLDRIFKTDVNGKNKIEIWANIKQIDTASITKKLIFWQDEKGHFHDETPHLPIELRDLIDNAWIEKKRYW